MGKKLSEMTLEELWKLFPITLCEHRTCWKDWYEQQEAQLRAILPPEKIARISHIGSTAVETLSAKPIIDILLELPEGVSAAELESMLFADDWLCMARSDKRWSFNKGYTENGYAERVFHLHVQTVGDPAELYFRDYLRAYPQAARVYETLKIRLLERFAHDRDGYTAAKSRLVDDYTQKARREFGGRYLLGEEPSRPVSAPEIRRAEENDLSALAMLAVKLWPSHLPDDLQVEFAETIRQPDAAFFLAFTDTRPVGFAQCGLRHDYVEGTDSSPVGYLEGVYVEPEVRRTGVAAQLVAACENWARKQGCSEFASDCELDNLDSLRFHLGTGFTEANRIICFTKRLS